MTPENTPMYPAAIQFRLKSECGLDGEITPANRRMRLIKEKNKPITNRRSSNNKINIIVS